MSSPSPSPSSPSPASFVRMRGARGWMSCCVHAYSFAHTRGTMPCVYVRAYSFALSKGAPPLVCVCVRYARACTLALSKGTVPRGLYVCDFRVHGLGGWRREAGGGRSFLAYVPIGLPSPEARFRAYLLTGWPSPWARFRVLCVAPALVFSPSPRARLRAFLRPR